MLFTLTASNRRAAHRGRKEMVDHIGRGGVAACCVVTVMPPPGAKQGNRKTGQNSKANRPPDRIKDLHVRRTAENQQEEDAEARIQGRDFFSTNPPRPPNSLTLAVRL